MREVIKSTLLTIAGVAFSGVSQAQANSPIADAPVSSEIHQAAPSCELHIFPTTAFINSSLEFGSPPGLYGMAGDMMGAALTSAQRSGSGALIAPGLEQMRTLLSPKIQIDMIKGTDIVSLLGLPTDTKIVVEDPIPNEDQIKNDPSLKSYTNRIMTAMKNNVAISPSAPACYRELFVTSISLQKNLGLLKFSAAFLYRTFDSNHYETHLYDGQRTIPKPEHFPATSVDQMEQAGADARAAFIQIFKDWVAHRVKL